MASELDGQVAPAPLPCAYHNFFHAGKYEPFDAVTRKSLLHAARDSGSTLSADAVEKVMAFYHALPTFDDAAPAWHDLNEVQGVDCWIFSNGTQEVRVSDS
jgi:2-haloacid dehalogenase